MKLTNGKTTVKTEVKRTGRDARVIPEVTTKTGTMKTGEVATLTGPFATSDHPAIVGGDVRITLSENYHSVSVGVVVQIPVNPTEAAVQEGLNYCFDQANATLNMHVKEARAALKKLAGTS